MSTNTPDTIRRTLWPHLTAIGTGAGIVAAVAGLLTLTSTQPAASAQTANTAYGIAATGVDDVTAQPSVSSSGEITSRSAGSVSGQAGTFTASGLTVRAGAGLAEATVTSLTVGGRQIGSINAKCANGVSTVTHSGSPISEPNLTVTYGSSGSSKAVGAKVTIIGADGEPAETITVAVVTCGTSTPEPTPTSTPPNPTTSQPTPNPTGAPSPNPTTRTTAPKQPANPPVPAPAPTPLPGHHPVTG